jgi:uncharacterized protein with HEPN domain
LLAQQFVEGFTYEQFRDSRLHFYAVTRALEIVSEASRRLPDDVRDRHPGLPWRAIRDVGNFYRHQYDNVAESYMQATVHNDLPPLRDDARVRAARDPADESRGSLALPGSLKRHPTTNESTRG